MEREAQTLIHHLRDARKRELEVLSGLTPTQMAGQKMKEIEPPIWEMGHVGWFQELWTSRHLDGAPPIDPTADERYHSFSIPNAERWELAFPTFKETLTYINAVLERTIARLERDDVTEEDVYFTRLAINHEDMHSETMVHIRQTLGYTQPEIADTRNTPVPIETAYEPFDVRIPGGIYLLGALKDGFIFDNEKWSHPVEIEPFAISSTPVTMGDYLRFVEAGGYGDRSIWSDEGWEWRSSAGAERPAFWARDGEGWIRRVFAGDAPLDPHLPMVHVNWFEADAYARWTGRRLPTEAEWELAASSEPSPDGRSFTTVKRRYPWGDEPPDESRANLDSAAQGLIDVRSFPAGDSAWGLRGMIGNVWEWTASTFEPYPGFFLDPYETYSEPSFGQQKVLRGGCWVTRGRVIRNTFRNFYTPDRNNIYAGFRTAVSIRSRRVN
ncbi:MAG TPA: selenoneine synthase SenA [Anaerolineales bacterium]|nr:selenoneine synthase SenA [Anaerolineales bacterium]